LLLELREELGIVLSVVHFNHKLRGAESDADERFVADLAREHGLEFFCDSGDVAQCAAQRRISVEAAARELRYEFFRRLLGEGGPQGLKPPVQEEPALRGPKGPLFHGASGGTAGSRTLPRLDKILTGHTLDDQAETVLMRLIRGSGFRGLGAIYPRLEIESEDGETTAEIIRPLLPFRRRELEAYLIEIGQLWRDDSTNDDAGFTRNRVRKLLVPLLEKEFNPSIAENLAELAEIARAEEDFWENEIAGWMGTAIHWSEPEWAQKADDGGLVQISSAAKTPVDSDLHSRIDAVPWLVANASLNRMWFLAEPIAAQRRIVKAIGEHAGLPLEFKHVEQIRQLAEEGKGGRELPLPLGWKLVCGRDELLFVTPDLREPVPAQDYEYPLAVPGEIVVHEGGFTIITEHLAADAASRDTGQLLDAQSLPGPLRVRNWRAGDRFWPAHTKSSKKIKELLQERRLPQAERRLWPVVASGDEIVWLKGFPASAKYRPKPGGEAILITAAPIAVCTEEKRIDVPPEK
jgi:tRNA(Ile)-lysidine synthase